MQIRSALERWPLRHPFSISRRTYTESLVATVTVEDGEGFVGRGEGEPHDSQARIARERLADAGIAPGGSEAPAWLDGLTRGTLLQRLSRSPVRNAVDCALWDLEAKRASTRAWQLAGMAGAPVPVMPTIGIDTPDAMAGVAAANHGTRWLKVKVGRDDGRDGERMEAVAAAAPGALLLVDANAGWTVATLKRLLPLADSLGVRIVEQPLDPRLDAEMPRPPPGIEFCADESCLDRTSLAAVRGRFQRINIKLDKAGGLTEALALREAAERAGLGVMVGMMSGTSLAVAPAFVLAQGLDVVDLEVGFLTRDREPPLRIRDFVLQAPEAALWG